MAEPSDLYGRSLLEGFELILVAADGSICLTRRPADAIRFTGFLGFPVALIEDGSSPPMDDQQPDPGKRRDPLPAPDEPATRHAPVWQARLKELTGSSTHRDAVPLGWWATPPFSPHRVRARVLRIDLDSVPTLLEGEWHSPDALLEAWQAGTALLEPPVLAFLRGRADASFHIDADWIEPRPGLWMIPLRTPTIPPATHTNCYLFGDQALVAVDPASPYPEEQERLEAALARLASQGRRLAAVVLTHHHPDHIGGVARLRERFGVPVIAHPDTGPLVAPEIELQGTLGEGERLPVQGGELVGWFTPGHAWGHLCLQDTRSDTFIVGDMVAGWGTIAVVPPEGDMQQYLSQLERLKTLLPSLLLPAHGPPIGTAQAKLEEYIQHRLLRESQVLTVLEACPSSPFELVAQIYEGLPPGLIWAAVSSILAHLNKLEAEGRVRQEEGRYELILPSA